MISKSFGTTVSANNARASRTISGPKYRLERCVSTSMRAAAIRASSAAWAAVEWPVSSALVRSSSENVASWTSTSASFAASSTVRAGRVSPEITTFRPGLGGPSTCSGRTVDPPMSSTASPR